MTILTDSLTALTSTVNISKGHPARSGIERTIGSLLHRRHSEGCTANISWVKAHIGIPGNGTVDKLVVEASSRGKDSLVITAEGIRAQTRRPRPSTRSESTTWGNKALAAYTWCHTNKGPQHSWLH